MYVVSSRAREAATLNFTGFGVREGGAKPRAGLGAAGCFFLVFAKREVVEGRGEGVRKGETDVY